MADDERIAALQSEDGLEVAPGVCVRLRSLADYRQNDENPVSHTPRNLGSVIESIHKVGAARSGFSSKGKILAGNLTHDAMAEAGIEGIIEVTTDGTQWVMVNREDLTEEQEKQAAYGDQQGSFLAGWELDQVLADVEAGVDLSGIFADFELETILGEAWAGEETGEAPEPQIDKGAELAEKYGVQVGQIWALGEHRLACGDCTDKAVVEAVMRGEKAELLFTSPPYVQQRDYTAASDVSDWDKLMMDAFAIAPMAKDGQILVNLGLVHHDGEWQPYWQDWIEWMREQGWRRFGWYVWDQGPGLPGDWAGRFAPSFEFVFHFNCISVHPQKTQECKHAGLIYMGKGGLRGRDGKVSDWTHRGRPVQPMKIPDSVCRVSREKSSYLYEHPAMFSEGFAEYFISAWMGIVYEPFSGSGTALIACEQLGRKCRAIEIEPKYCAITIQRWVDLTGKEPKLLP